MNKEFFAAVKQLENEKGISAEYLYDQISNAIVVALRRDYGGKDIVFCDIDPEKDIMRTYVRKNVVSEIDDLDTDILPEKAQQYKQSAKPGDIIEIPVDTTRFGRIAAQTVKHVIRQGIKEAEKGKLMEEFQSKHQELVTAKVILVDPVSGNATVEIGKVQAVLPRNEQVVGEVLGPDDLIKIYVVDILESERGPRAMISRTHPGLVKRLFETEVPEVYDGTVEIRGVAREAGSRTKISVSSSDPNLDPIGACIGQRGTRVGKVVELLGGEKIDIVKYSDDPREYVASALAPADVISVEILNEQDKVCRVVVPDDQLSLAIGHKGQNARLSAKITGWKIDITSDALLAKQALEEEAANPTVKEEEIEEIEIEEIETQETSDVIEDDKKEETETQEDSAVIEDEEKKVVKAKKTTDTVKDDKKKEVKAKKATATVKDDKKKAVKAKKATDTVIDDKKKVVKAKKATATVKDDKKKVVKTKKATDAVKDDKKKVVKTKKTTDTVIDDKKKEVKAKKATATVKDDKEKEVKAKKASDAVKDDKKKVAKTKKTTDTVKDDKKKAVKAKKTTDTVKDDKKKVVKAKKATTTVKDDKKKVVKAKKATDTDKDDKKKVVKTKKTADTVIDDKKKAVKTKKTTDTVKDDKKKVVKAKKVSDTIKDDKKKAAKTKKASPIIKDEKI